MAPLALIFCTELISPPRPHLHRIARIARILHR